MKILLKFLLLILISISFTNAYSNDSKKSETYFKLGVFDFKHLTDMTAVNIKKVTDNNVELPYLGEITQIYDLMAMADIQESFSDEINKANREEYAIYFSSGYQKNYNTNVYEAQINNDFNFTSYDFFTNKGLVSNYNLLLKNYNTYSENSDNFEDNSDHELFTTISLNTKFPLQKKLLESTNYLTPRVQFNFSPTNGRDLSSDSVRLNYDNIFSSSRIGRTDMVEEGKSLTLGLEFEKQNFENEKIFGFNIGNVIKDEKNMSMPKGLNQTRSEIVGNISYIPNKNLNLEYNFSYDRDLDHSNYDSISSTFKVNNFIADFDYLNP